MSKSNLSPGQIQQFVYDPNNEAYKVFPAPGASFNSGLVPEEYDEISLTYITSGNGTGEIGTVVYELASVTVATLTLTYDVSNKLINVIKS